MHYMLYNQSLDKSFIDFLAVSEDFEEVKRELFKLLSDRVIANLESGELKIPEFDYLPADHVFSEAELFINRDLSIRSIRNLGKVYSVPVRTDKEYTVIDRLFQDYLIITPCQNLTIFRTEVDNE